VLRPAERLIVVNAAEAMSGDTPTRRIPLHDRPRGRPLDLHALGDTDPTITYCRAKDLSQDADRALERAAARPTHSRRKP